MTQQEQDAYAAAWAAQAKVAKARGLVITGVIWRDGHMSCQMDPPAKAPPPEPARPSSSRGVARQGLLI